MVDSTVNQYTSSDDGIFFRTRAQYQAQLVAEGDTPADATSWMNNNGMSNVSTHAKVAEGITREALVKVFDKHFRKDIPGVSISQVAVVHNLIAAAVAVGTYQITSRRSREISQCMDENHCGFLSLLDQTQRGALGFASTSEITTAHEFGHHFFLPHPAPVNGESGYKAHDTTVSNCLMSYWPAARVLCGLCQLRLRGWKQKFPHHHAGQ